MCVPSNNLPVFARSHHLTLRPGPGWSSAPCAPLHSSPWSSHTNQFRLPGQSSARNPHWVERRGSTLVLWDPRLHSCHTRKYLLLMYLQVNWNADFWSDSYSHSTLGSGLSLDFAKTIFIGMSTAIYALVERHGWDALAATCHRCHLGLEAGNVRIFHFKMLAIVTGCKSFNKEIVKSLV